MALKIPDKLYYKIGEVATLLDVKTHVLRYWETEFNALKPVKSRSNQRLYRREDVETALLIKDLLYRQGFTIAGARKRVTSKTRDDDNSSDNLPYREVLCEVRNDLSRIRERLLSARLED